MEDISRKYQVLNRSFKKRMIWHLGIDAGFFAEYTYMLNAMLYCLKHHIQFVLYSKDANFGCENGWGDYFEPFCEEVDEDFHSRYNKHRVPSWKKIFGTKSVRMLKWKLKSVFQNRMGDVMAYRHYRQWVLLNHHLKFDFSEHYYIPELGIDGNYLHAFKVMVDITWHLKPELKEEGRKLIAQLKLPDSFIGCQVRGGDKITETELLTTDFFINTIRECNRKENLAFVLTDDFRIYEELQVKCPELEWRTLCAPQEAGYINSSFSVIKGKEKYAQMLRFLTSMEVLMHSSFFIGSVTTGPSLFLLKWFYPNHCPIDCSRHLFDEVVTMPIAGRSRISKVFLRNMHRTVS